MKAAKAFLERAGAALLLLTAVAACGSSSDGDGGPGPVNLGASADFVILAKAGVTNVPTSVITGDVGVSPGTSITGLALVPDPIVVNTTVSATSAQVTGTVYAANFAPATQTMLTAAVGAMELAFTDAAGRAAGATELGDGEIGGMTLAPGVYKWGTGLGITTDVTLSGSSSDVWIFQVAQGITVAADKKVILSGGAKAKNVFWQAGGAVTLGAGAHLEGTVLTMTAVTLGAGASVDGRLFAQTAVSMNSSTVSKPAP